MAATAQFRVSRSRWEILVLELSKAPVSAWFGLVVILIYCVVAILAPLLAPYGEAEIVSTPFVPWSWEHKFGTDQIGRDIFSRLVYGARNTMGIAVITTVLSFFIGGTLGLIAAILGGWLDQFVSRVVDAIMAIPSLIFALMLLAIFGSNVVSLIVIIAVLDSTASFSSYSCRVFECCCHGIC